MPKGKYKKYIRELTCKKPKRTLAGEKKALKDKLTLVKDDDNIFIPKERKKYMLMIVQPHLI
jgi:hypothetical protein